ncbi:MAG: hypothetical protein HDS67_02200 [Bacteroidales bacterium]|nr:hypothetical protein [Bacteroidales bacterium]
MNSKNTTDNIILFSLLVGTLLLGLVLCTGCAARRVSTHSTESVDSCSSSLSISVSDSIASAVAVRSELMEINRSIFETSAASFSADSIVLSRDSDGSQVMVVFHRPHVVTNSSGSRSETRTIARNDSTVDNTKSLSQSVSRTDSELSRTADEQSRARTVSPPWLDIAAFLLGLAMIGWVVYRIWKLH